MRLFAAFTVVSCASLAHASLVTNGSLTGNPQEGVGPAGWSTGSQGADIVTPGGLASTSGPGGWFAYQMPASTDGGTFSVLWGRAGHPFSEFIDQSISGLAVGETYRLTFQFANAGWFQGSSIYPNEVSDGFLNVTLGATTQSTSVLSFQGFGSQTWHNVTMDFVAASTTETLRFRASDTTGTGNTRIAVDGVALNVIPSPASASLLLAGVLSLRRRSRG